MKVLKITISSTTEWDSFIPAYLVECSWIGFTLCFVPLPCCGTYNEPHLPFTIKWIHRKRFHRGVSSSESKLVSGDLCETLHEPLHPSLGSVSPHLSPCSPTRLNTSLTLACYSHHTARVLISNGSHMHSNFPVFLTFSCSRECFRQLCLRCILRKKHFWGHILWVTLEILCVVFLGVWRTVNQVYVLC